MSFQCADLRVSDNNLWHLSLFSSCIRRSSISESRDEVTQPPSARCCPRTTAAVQPQLVWFIFGPQFELGLLGHKTRAWCCCRGVGGGGEEWERRLGWAQSHWADHVQLVSAQCDLGFELTSVTREYSRPKLSVTRDRSWAQLSVTRDRSWPQLSVCLVHLYE